MIDAEKVEAALKGENITRCGSKHRENFCAVQVLVYKEAEKRGREFIMSFTGSVPFTARQMIAQFRDELKSYGFESIEEVVGVMMANDDPSNDMPEQRLESIMARIRDYNESSDLWKLNNTRI
jgi:hypothetical protein